MLEENFSQRCNVTESVDYGYSDSPPDVSNNNPYGYGDAAPSPLSDPYVYGSSSSKDVDKYGYGDGCPSDGAAKYGYGHASPNNDVAKYGYGDASPHHAAKYGYGDSSADDAAKYGYGDASPKDETSAYGYGDGSPDGRSSHGTTSGSGADDTQPQRRPRRRNSVTRYSIVAQDAVKQEFVAHANVIDQFRQGLDFNAAPPSGQLDEPFIIPLKDSPSKSALVRDNGASGDNDGMSCDGNSVEGLSDDDLHGDKKDKSTKKRRGLGRFRIGRSSSHLSKDSASCK